MSHDLKYITIGECKRLSCLIKKKDKQMTELVDKIFFVQLNEQDPAAVCRRALCAHDEATGTYAVTVWENQYAVDSEKATVTCLDPDHEPLHPYFHLFAVHYLLGAREIQPAGQWISEKDITGGATFFRGPHEIPAHMIASRFDGDITGFKNRCEQYGGTVLDLADAAFVFSITPRIPLAVLYWQGDDEFPTEVKLLFDKTIDRHLASDTIYALAVGVCDLLGR